ncbi:11132_t:CDS:2, partial [Acaulospora morrowiae]
MSYELSRSLFANMKFLRFSFELHDLFGLCLALLAAGIINYYYKYYTRENPLPAPFPLPFVGHLFDHLIAGKDYYEYCCTIHSKYGHIFEQWHGRKRIIFVTKPEYLDILFSSSTKSKYLIRVHDPEGLKDLGIYGTGLLLNHDIDNWRFNRQFFTQAVQTTDFLREAVGCTQAAFNEMNEYSKLTLGNDVIIDFSKLSRTITTDVIFQMITGKKLWTTASYFSTISSKSKLIKLQKFDEENMKKSSKISRAFETFLSGIFFFIVFPKWIRKYLPNFRVEQNNILQARDYLFKDLKDIIQERRKEIEDTPKDERLKYNMLTLLITANTDRSISDVKDKNNEYTEPLTDKEIRGIILEALGGGIDTSASTFNFAIYYISRYPDVKSRLCKEIDDLYTQCQNKPITFEELSCLTYCDAVIKEVSRIANIVPFLSRISSESDIIENTRQDAGTNYIIFTPGVHLSEDYWKDPKKFDVDRFIDTDGQSQQKKHNLLAWGGGLKQCPGRKLVMIELKCLLVLAFRNWDIELVNPSSSLE